jgi:hypothetical protein
MNKHSTDRRRPLAVRAAGATLALAALVPGTASAQEAREAGRFEVDPEAAERALERTLTAEGALLLPPGRVEIEPSVQYTRRESDGIVFDRAPSGAVTNFGEVEVERDETRIALDLRVGLPLNAQLEVGLPYQFVSSETTRVDFATGRQTESSSGSGLEDVTVGVAATVLRERGWVPDVVARVTWDGKTAKETDDDLLLSQSFHELRGSLTFLKRQDPLAFVGSVFYETAFEDDGIEPGDRYGFGLEAVLAASPDTSLRVGFQQSFSSDAEVDGRTVSNSGETQGILLVGASTILGDGVLMNITAGAGLSDDAPDYFIRVGFPIRFGWSLY